MTKYISRFLAAYEASTEKRWHHFSWQMFLSIGFSILALLLAIFCPALPYKWFCFGGMALSSLGDFLLSPHPIAKKIYGKGNRLIVGGSAFAIAHCVYAYAFYQKAKMHGGLPGFTWICFAVLFSFAAILLVLENEKNKKPNYGFLMAILVYEALICFNCTMIFGSAVAGGNAKDYLAFLGAGFFFASDAILLAGVVGPKTIPFYEAWIWITYPLAQILLICCA